MIYDKLSGYYFLFVSYGSLKSDYNIRVGRSRNITGPFLDYHGKDLAGIQDDVLQDDDGHLYLISHIRQLNFYDAPEPSLLQSSNCNSETLRNSLSLLPDGTMN